MRTFQNSYGKPIYVRRVGDHFRYLYFFADILGGTTWVMGDKPGSPNKENWFYYSVSGHKVSELNSKGKTPKAYDDRNNSNNANDHVELGSKSVHYPEELGNQRKTACSHAN